MSVVTISKTPQCVYEVTIDRADQRNALNNEVMAELVQAFHVISEDPEARAVVLTGAGDKAFCAGGDIKAGSAAKGEAKDNPYMIAPGAEHPLAALFRVVRKLPIPVIARVNGHALGGGFGLVCMADLAVVSRNAKLGSPEAKLGLFPMIILAHMLRLVSMRQLYEMALTARSWSADEAKANGIVNDVVDTPDQLDEAINKLLEPILANSPTAIRVGKKALQSMEEMDFEQRLDHAQVVISQLAQTDDAREGMAAFAEKRPPVWTGR